MSVPCYKRGAGVSPPAPELARVLSCCSKFLGIPCVDAQSGIVHEYFTKTSLAIPNRG